VLEERSDAVTATVQEKRDLRCDKVITGAAVVVLLRGRASCITFSLFSFGSSPLSLHLSHSLSFALSSTSTSFTLIFLLILFLQFHFVALTQLAGGPT
jgi:hypothetical protein